MYINTQTLTQHTEQDIRNLNPNTSFSTPFVAPEPYAWVFPSPQPTVTNLQVVREIAPILTSKGHYEQQWEVADKFQDYADTDGVLHTKAEQEAAYLEQLRLASVPQVVSRAQFILALLQLDLLDDVEAAIAAADRATQINYKERLEFERSFPLVAVMAAALGKTDREVDDLFTLAATL